MTDIPPPDAPPQPERRTYDERLRFALAIVMVGGVFVTIGALLYIDHAGFKDLITYLVASVVGGGALMILNWFYGSSQGSNEKSKTIDRIATGAEPTGKQEPPS